MEPEEPGVVLTVELPDSHVLEVEAGYCTFALNRYFLSFEDQEMKDEKELKKSCEKKFDIE